MDVQATETSSRLFYRPSHEIPAIQTPTEPFTDPKLAASARNWMLKLNVVPTEASKRLRSQEIDQIPFTENDSHSKSLSKPSTVPEVASLAHD